MLKTVNILLLQFGGVQRETANISGRFLQKKRYNMAQGYATLMINRHGTLVCRVDENKADQSGRRNQSSMKDQNSRKDQNSKIDQSSRNDQNSRND